MKLTTAILTMTLLVLGATAALAQRAASTKELGTAYDMWSSGLYFDHALDHSRVLQNYSRYEQPVPPEIVRRHAEAIRSNLAAAKKSYAGLAEKHPDDKTASGHLATLDAHHGDACESLDKLDAAAAGGNSDPKAVKEHSAGAIRSLRAAKMEHNKLMQHLGVEDTMGKGKGKSKRKADAAD
ncbi:MAG: hypothetical protein WD845_17400 [Pirellulales bacterium]